VATSTKENPRGAPGLREWISRQFTRVEDVVYVGLGILLAASAATLMVVAAVGFGRSLFSGSFPAGAIDLLDRILLVLMIVELLYTVQVSFREHTLVPEPFLIVGLIAATRRILVLTAEFTGIVDKPEAAFRNAMLELGLLTVLVVAMVVSLVLLRKRPAGAVADRT
jgi:uncharacterized membrane protein (DUF373 family)